MVKIETGIWIDAPVEVCFDLARDIGVHTQTTWPFTKERAIAGVTSGMIGDGETVTFQATHFGVRQKLTSLVSEYRRPYVFVDSMQRGAFKSLRHEHYFEPSGSGTRLRDVLYLEAPLGPLGWLAERLVLRTYMRRFLEYRNRGLKQLAEQRIAPQRR
ncbi:SRPBCC family protein [Paenibacillus protaetiae]|uniref:Cell division protein n=1 Tax=Paenibacillus protaetiae TaxID=2509456 RepID=A0A4P6EZ57_9BACL|nr:SRPBCC family protein [Paenibacillus protaetiae]QAY67089.1 cell division protein [Paenibacillus protaetiae]